MLVLTRRIDEEVWIAGGKSKVIVRDIYRDIGGTGPWVGMTCESVGYLYGNGSSFYCLADKVKVTVVDINPVRGIVKLGFDADRSITIDREEIHAIKTGTTWGLTHGTDATRKGEVGRAGSSEEDFGTVWDRSFSRGPVSGRL